MDTSKSATRIANAQRRLKEKAANLAKSKIPSLRRESSLQDRPLPPKPSRGGPFGTVREDESDSRLDNMSETKQRQELFSSKSRVDKKDLSEESELQTERSLLFGKTSDTPKISGLKIQQLPDSDTEISAPMTMKRSLKTAKLLSESLVLKLESPREITGSDDRYSKTQEILGNAQKADYDDTFSLELDEVNDPNSDNPLTDSGKLYFIHETRERDCAKPI